MSWLFNPSYFLALLCTVATVAAFHWSNHFRAQTLATLLEASELEIQNFEYSKTLRELENADPAYLVAPGLVWPSEDVRRVGELLQDRVLRAAEENRLSARRFAILSMGRGQKFLRIGFTIEVEGRLRSLASFLGQIESMEKKVAVESMRIRQGRSRENVDGGTLVSAAFKFWIFAQPKDEEL